MWALQQKLVGECYDEPSFHTSECEDTGAIALTSFVGTDIFMYECKKSLQTWRLVSDPTRCRRNFALHDKPPTPQTQQIKQEIKMEGQMDITQGYRTMLGLPGI